MEIVSKDVGDRFDHEMARGYRTQEDHIDTAGAVPGHTKYPVVNQLREESEKRWMSLFGNVDACNEVIDAHHSLQGVSKGTLQALMGEKDPAVQAKEIEKLEMELIRGKASIVGQ
jgi:hypothetical protein